MPTNYNDLYKKEINKLKRQIKKYEKEGVRFLANLSDFIDETPKKKYTQTDIDMIKSTKQVLFKSATMFDEETGKVYKGQQEISNRIRTRNQQQKQLKQNYETQLKVESDIGKTNKSKDKKEILVERKQTSEIASLKDSIFQQSIDFLSNFNVYSEFPGRDEWFCQEKEKQRLMFLSLFSDIINVVGEYKFLVVLNDSYELFEDLKGVMYDSTEFSDTPSTMRLVELLYKIGHKIANNETTEIINDFINKTGISETDYENYINEPF